MRHATDTIRQFLKRRRVPNKKTIEAIKQANVAARLKQYDSFRELRETI